MDADINKYDLNHAVTTHSRMSMDDWLRAYQSAWDAYHTDEHIETVLKRAAATALVRAKRSF
jgi:predicted metal-dependent HD superfamily phosphohydrolase